MRRTLGSSARGATGLGGTRGSEGASQGGSRRGSQGSGEGGSQGAHHRSVRRSLAGAVLLTGVLALATTACTAPAPAETSSAPSRGTPTVDVTESPTPTPAPVLVPGGTAADNLPFFRSVVEQVWAGAENARGSAYIAALTGAGFDRAAMQITADTTTIGQPVESLQVAVAWSDGCLVGQVGPATGDPVAVVLPRLAGGGCLIGDTASVDG